MSHHAIGTAECDESYCIEGCGDFVYHESNCDESVIMTIYGFQIFCDVSSGGWRRVLIWHMGGVYPYMGPSTPPRVFRVHKTEHSLLLIALPGSYMVGHVVKRFIMSCFVQSKDIIHYVIDTSIKQIQRNHKKQILKLKQYLSKYYYIRCRIDCLQFTISNSRFFLLHYQ